MTVSQCSVSPKGNFENLEFWPKIILIISKNDQIEVVGNTFLNALYLKDFEPENVPYTKMDKEVDVEKYINNDEPEEEDDDSLHPESDDSGEDYATIFGGKMDENKKSTGGLKKQGQKNKHTKNENLRKKLKK